MKFGYGYIIFIHANEITTASKENFNNSLFSVSFQIQALNLSIDKVGVNSITNLFS
jgi:hypothetical protein